MAKKQKVDTGEAKAKRSPEDQAAVDLYRARRAARPVSPPFAVKHDAGGVAQVSVEHEDGTVATAQQITALGLSSVDEYLPLLKGILNASLNDGQVGADDANGLVSLAIGIGPQNTTEAMLAIQMAAVHRETMDALRRLRGAATTDRYAVYQKSANNLSRTFATLAETLKKLRSTGEQKVTVEHRHYHLHPGAVAPGAQAVIGDVRSSPEGASGKIEDQSHGRDWMRLPVGQAVLGPVEALGVQVPGTSAQGEARMSVPRGNSRGAVGTG